MINIYMNNANEMLETRNGTYKRWNGKYWISYIKTNCNECKKMIFVHTSNFKKNKKAFCTKQCQMDYYQKNEDPKGYNILNNTNDVNFYYLLGLICTDGYLAWPKCSKTQKSSYVEITLQQKDDYILYQIQDIFGGNIKTVKRKKRKSVVEYTRWCLCGCKFVDYLRNTVGITSDKSHTLNVAPWFNALSDNYKRAFMRGVLDGDGCISIHKNIKQYAQYTCAIVSASDDFLNMIYEYFGGHLSHQNVRFHGKQIIEKLTPIYDFDKNNEIYIKRKYNKFLEIKQIEEHKNA